MKTLPPFPDELSRVARTVGNGELFWPITVAAAVASHITSAGLGICGGEIYVAQGRTWGNMELEWATEPGWDGGEKWTTYVTRGMIQALAAIDHGLRMFGDAADSEPMCFFAVYSADGYPHSGTTPTPHGRTILARAGSVRAG